MPSSVLCGTLPKADIRAADVRLASKKLFLRYRGKEYTYDVVL